MKRIKSLCIALVLALLVTYVPVSAAVQDDTMIKMQQKDTSQLELALYPQWGYDKEPLNNLSDPNADNRGGKRKYR